MEHLNIDILGRTVIKEYGNIKEHCTHSTRENKSVTFQ